MADPVATRFNLTRQPVPVQDGGWETYSPSLYAPTTDSSGGRRAGTGARMFTRSASSPSSVLAYFRYAGALSDAIADGAASGTSGQTYTASVYVRASVACRATFSFRAYDAAASELVRVSSAEVTAAADTWVRVVCTLTAPASTAWLGIHGFYVRTQSGISTGGVQVWATDGMVEQAGSAGDYFDGGMADFTVADLTYQHSWLGTAWLSPSRQDAFEAASGEEKSATASVPLALAPAGAGAKTAASGSALSVALAAGSPAAKQGASLSLLSLLLSLSGAAGKDGATSATLATALAVAASTTTAERDLTIHLGDATRAGIVPGATSRVTITPGETS